MAKFTEDDALEAIEGNKEADEFESKYPNCVINVGKLSPKKSEDWIKKNKGAIKGEPPKNIWYVEYEELDVEKLILYINPNDKKVVGTKVEKLKAPPEEE
ncbi:MAG: hypothetical protein ACTSWR_01835 [Candidatus Helarchaeota archaeon]